VKLRRERVTLAPARSPALSRESAARRLRDYASIEFLTRGQASNRSVTPGEHLILGIESSCDETAAAVVAGGVRILSNVVASQIDIHRRYGGVVPELASREHLRRIVPVVREAAEQARIKLQDVDAVAVTSGPGLIGALLVGVTYGKVLAQALGKPLVAVNHLEGHIHAVLLEAHAAGRAPRLPAVCLIVSGGHTVLYAVRSDSSNGARPFSYVRIGGTRDDAAGEAYDKVARMLALGYPGGPIVDRLAAHGNPRAVRFGTPKMSSGNPHDFSFSGIKTAVLYHLRRNAHLEPEIEARRQSLARGERGADHLRALSSAETLDLIASFQRAVVDDLVTRTLAAAAERVRTVLVSGGVAANSELRRTFETEAARRGLDVFFPSRALSTDNAAMIAAAGHARFLAGERADMLLDPSANLPLA
jgi:tRNA N6-adenosine threonylcarbamoyltransferase